LCKQEGLAFGFYEKADVENYIWSFISTECEESERFLKAYREANERKRGLWE
jgi:hypothetical protein